MNPSLAGLEAFPPWLQVLLSALAFMGAAYAYLRGAWGKPPARSTDVVVPSINVMDGQTLRDAAQILRDTLRHAEQRGHDVQNLQRELRRHTELLESIDERLRRMRGPFNRQDED